MERCDVDYARDIFTDLALAWTTKWSRAPSLSESKALAREAFKMAVAFSAARYASISTRNVAEDDPNRVATPTLARSGMTFAQLAREWAERVVKRSAGHSKRDLVSRFERYVIPHLGNKPVAEVDPQEILSVLRGIESAGYTAMAYQTFKDLRFMYRYAIVAGLTNYDPTSVLRRAVNQPRRRGTRMLLDPASVGRLLGAIKEYKGKPRSSARLMLRLAPMVFLRASELRTLEWKDVDLDAATIVIPASRLKSRRPHIVPLARQAVRLLEDAQRMTAGLRYVFNGGRGVDKPLDFGIFHVMLRTLGYGNLVSAHGFRVLASTWLNEAGWPAEAIERQLSHLGSDRTRRLYNHAEHLLERRKMMQAWANHLQTLEHKAKLPLHLGPVFRGGRS